jgi:hypothetical protein
MLSRRAIGSQQRKASTVAAVERFFDPSENRPLLVEFEDPAQCILATRLGPATGIAYAS